MPDVFLYAKPDWLPAIEQCRPGVPLTDQMLSTQHLIAELPQMIVDAVNDVDESALSVTEVVIYPDFIHPWGYNTPDVYIDLQPGDIDASEAEREERRARIEAHLRDSIERHLERTGYARPWYDVEVRPKNGTGTSVSTSGAVVSEWGKPKKYRVLGQPQSA